jgi:hypothetical protein
MPVTVTGGVDDATVDAGILPVTVGDWVWDDVNANGIQDTGEQGVAGVSVTVMGTDVFGHPVSKTATTADGTTPGAVKGSYAFTVAPGTYQVTFTAPTGWTASPTGQGADPAKASVGATPTGVTVTSGSNLNQDFGVYQPRSAIGDLVWLDLDGDGIQDAGEPGIPGVTVTLTGQDADGDPVSLTATTDADGKYEFTDVPAGTYTVHVDGKGGAFTKPGEGSDRGLDSNADASGDMTAIVTAGQDDSSVDAGVLPVTIGDWVWDDADADGVQDTGEQGVAGVGVAALASGFFDGRIAKNVSASCGVVTLR